VVTAVALVLGLVVLYHLGLYFYVDQKITRVQALATDGPEILAPQLQADEQNYLVVGTGVPGQTGPASVATLIASVSPKGDRAVLVSVPPTALVDTPVCRTSTGALRNPATEAFAASLLDGGPSCMVRAIQQLSGLRIDHYLGVDLRRLPGMVDALGGVPICTVPSPATQAAAKPPPPGSAQLSGTGASGFLRPGNPRDDVTGAAVAERSQRLLTSTLRAALSTSTLADPPRLARFLFRAADALTVDEQTTLGDLRTLAGSLGGLSGDAVQRAGLPVDKVGYRPAGSRQAYVLLDSVATRSLFDTVIGHTRIPADVLAGAAGGGDAAPPPQKAAPATQTPATRAPATKAPAAPAGPGTVTVPPAAVTVDVLNGTGTKGLAGTVADQLRAQGFGVGTVGNETGAVTSSVVRYGPAALEKAKTVAAAVPGAVLQASASIGSAVQLVLGPGFAKVVQVQVSPPSPSPSAAAPVTTAAARTAPVSAPVSCG
jgi:LCP family protein required for cell wall assembly